MQRLRQRFPQAKITLLTRENLAQLWREHPCVDSVLPFLQGEGPWSVARRLRPHCFDAALVLPNSPRSVLEPWLAGVPRRFGYGGAFRNWFLTQSIGFGGELRARKRSVREIRQLVKVGNRPESPQPPKPSSHQLNHYLRLVAMLGCDPAPLAPGLQVRPEETQSALAVLTRLAAGVGFKATPSPMWLGLNASAAYGSAKRWPIERFASVVSQVCATAPRFIWVNFGIAADWDLGQYVSQAAPGRVINLAGKTTLRQLMALLSSCRVLLSNDSGPMHVAAALGVPVVVPFGSTSPELTGPGLPGQAGHQLLRGNAPCAPCFRRICPIDFRCMTTITVEQVVAAVLARVTSP